MNLFLNILGCAIFIFALSLMPPIRGFFVDGAKAIGRFVVKSFTSNNVDRAPNYDNIIP